MPCFKPIEAWRTTETTANGKKAIAFQRSANTTTRLTLPCGQCIGCRLDRSLVWATRCVHEAQLHSQNSFITLTYSPEHLPSDGSLVPWHYTDFMKRLRRRYPSNTIRYFMAAEYGEQLSRPHYHACLFGIDFPDKEIIKETEGILLYNSPTLDDIWGKGFTSIGEVTFETAAYTARYIMKKVTGENTEDHYYKTCEHTGNLYILEPEFVRMSLKPGIGEKWYQKYKSDLYPGDFAIMNHREVKIPRYYDKMYDLESDDFEEIRALRKENARKHLRDNTPERLAVREKVKQLKYKQFTRSYENDT